MIDKICCVVYKTINLIGWIMCILTGMAGTAFIVIVPYLGCRYGRDLSVKNSIIATVIVWTFIGGVCVVEAAYTRGRELKTKNRRNKND